MKNIVLSICAFLLIFLNHSCKKLYSSTFVIEKVVSYEGISTSREMLNDICKGKLIRYNRASWSLSHNMFAPGTGSITCPHSPNGPVEPSFFDMYNDKELLVSQRVVREEWTIVETKYSNELLRYFPYRGTSEYFRPYNSIVMCKMNIKNHKGTIIISLDNFASIVFKVRQLEWDENRNLSLHNKYNLLDIKNVFEGIYPFRYKQTKVAGRLLYNENKSQNHAYSPKEEPINVDLIFSDNGDIYFVGFKCDKLYTGNHLTERSAGFVEPLKINDGNVKLVLLPVNEEDFGYCFGFSKSFVVSFNIKETFYSSEATYHPTGYSYRYKIRTVV